MDDACVALDQTVDAHTHTHSRLRMTTNKQAASRLISIPRADLFLEGAPPVGNQFETVSQRGRGDTLGALHQKGPP